MLTLLCRDIRGLYWISEVQEMSYGNNIYSWCIVVHINLRENGAYSAAGSLA